MNWIFLVLAGILASLSHISLKYGLTKINILVPELYSSFQKIPYWAGNLYIWLGILCLGISLLFWLIGLSDIKLNIAYPVLVGLEYSLIMFLSWRILGEIFIPFKIVGIAFILAGIIIISW